MLLAGSAYFVFAMKNLFRQHPPFSSTGVFELIPRGCSRPLRLSVLQHLPRSMQPSHIQNSVKCLRRFTPPTQAGAGSVTGVGTPPWLEPRVNPRWPVVTASGLQRCGDVQRCCRVCRLPYPDAGCSDREAHSKSDSVISGDESLVRSFHSRQ